MPHEVILHKDTINPDQMDCSFLLPAPCDKTVITPSNVLQIADDLLKNLQYTVGLQRGNVTELEFYGQNLHGMLVLAQQAVFSSDDQRNFQQLFYAGMQRSYDDRSQKWRETAVRMSYGAVTFRYKELLDNIFEKVRSRLTEKMDFKDDYVIFPQASKASQPPQKDPIENKSKFDEGKKHALDSDSDKENKSPLRKRQKMAAAGSVMAGEVGDSKEESKRPSNPRKSEGDSKAARKPVFKLLKISSFFSKQRPHATAFEELSETRVRGDVRLEWQKPSSVLVPSNENVNRGSRIALKI